jgi:hypothetical protein
MFSDGLNLFGLQIIPQKKDGNNSAALAAPLDDDGSVNVSSAAAYYGVYMDMDNAASKNEAALIQKYREISLYPEVEQAIQDIVNEAIPMEDSEQYVEALLDETELSDNLKTLISKEFEHVLALMDFRDVGADIFKRWYVDGRIAYQIIVDKTNPKKGITELIPLDATKVRKVRDIKRTKTESGVDAITDISEYFLYSESGFAQQNNTSTTTQTGVKISKDAIAYCSSGYMNTNNGTVLSYLDKAIRPANQLRMLEDASVIYMLARAPERRIFYVDVGNLPKAKAEQYMRELMNKYRNKMVYDSVTGAVKDDKKYMSLLEDFWMPRRNGKGTEIDTLPGASNLQGQLDQVDYFQKKLWAAMNVPLSRMQPDTGFSIGQSQEISRDEVKFQKFIDKLRMKFSGLFYDLLKTQLILTGVCNDVEWEDLKEKIKFKFQRDNYFSELKNLEILQSRMAIMPQVDPYLGKYFSKDWVQRKILNMTDEDIRDMDEQIDSEKGDPTAQPTFQGMPMDGMGGDPSQQDYGQDPNDPNQQDPNQQQGQQPYAQQ